MRYYATHQSGKPGTHFNHVITAKNDRGAAQALRMRAKAWQPGKWILSAPVNQNRPYGDLRIITVVTVVV